MEEHKVIAYVAVHLIKKEEADIIKISVQKIKYQSHIKKVLEEKKISRKIISTLKFTTKEEDIDAFLKFRTGRQQKRLVVEAKGGEVDYNFYTCLGQFICLKKSPSSYYWFAFALPLSWRTLVRKKLRDENGKIKPIVQDIISKYTKKGQGLWFYFVQDDGKVYKETWNQTLTYKD